ncbi:MAG TPA: type II secretion system F family protein [Kineosporiaceae bacterium]|nr:type II secretion system F family protein [Kineosporiaceae bacterium]
MTTELSASGALFGLLAGLGGWLIISRVPWRRAPTLDQRLAPYLRGIHPAGRPSVAAPAHHSPLDVVERVLGPFMGDALRWVERISGGTGTVRRRLDQLGGRRTIDQFRAEQVIWGVVGAAAGAAIGGLTVIGRGFSVVPVVGLVVIGTLLGVLGRDLWLSFQVRRRDRRILAEFPAVAELLALAVGAGEGPMGALERVARTCRGELSAELRRTVAEVRTGMPLTDALTGLANRTTLPSLARFVDGIVVAVDRGTPLAEVLRAQAQDVRELTRRQLMEAGGRREIGMMVPVVFLVLPVTVLFAVYPGLAVLDLNP